MPNFQVTIRRQVLTTESFERVIEADDETDALNIGAELAFESNGNCPDDCSDDGFFDASSFYVANAEPTEEPVDAD